MVPQAVFCMLVFTRQWHIQERNCKKIMVDKLFVLTNTALKSRIYCNSRHKASGVHISVGCSYIQFLGEDGVRCGGITAEVL